MAFLEGYECPQFIHKLHIFISGLVLKEIKYGWFEIKELLRKLMKQSGRGLTSSDVACLAMPSDEFIFI